MQSDNQEINNATVVSSIMGSDSDTSSVDSVIETNEEIKIIVEKNDETKKRVAEILNVDTVGWSIVDSVGDLHLVHYNDGADMSKVGNLRGVLVDAKFGSIAATSFGYTPNAVFDRLDTTSNKNCISVVDDAGGVHLFPKDEVTIKKVFEGVVIRAVLYDGKVHFITHRKINPEKSRWGNSKFFLEMYNEAGGPKPEELFDLSKKYSPYCHIFLVVHPSLLVGTRQEVLSPYVVHLSTEKMDVKYPEELTEAEVGSTFSSSEEIGGSISKSFIHKPKAMTIEEANHHLSCGYYTKFDTKESRLRTGEAVILYRISNGKITDIVKVSSSSYSWRMSMRDDNPNIYHRFVCLSDFANVNFDSPFNGESKFNDFKKKFIFFGVYPVKDIAESCKQNKGILLLQTENLSKRDLRSREEKLYIVWLNLLISLPTPLQEQALDFIDRLKKEKAELLLWLHSIATGAVVAEPDKDITETIEKIRRNFESYKRKTGKADMASSVSFVVGKYSGALVHRLIKRMKDSKKEIKKPVGERSKKDSGKYAKSLHKITKN